MRFPSGFDAEFRRLTGAEISRAANSPDTSSVEGIAQMLRAVWSKTNEPGPYTHADGDLTPQFDKFLSGDLMYGLVALAVDNVPDGRTYRFDVQCERRHEDRQYRMTIDLVDQLLDPESDEDSIKLRRLSEPTAYHLRTKGNRFETTIDGHAVVYKLQSPSDMAVAAKLRKMCGPGREFGTIKDFTHAETLAVQCLEVDGKSSLAERYRFFLGLDVGSLYSALDKVQALDCGIDTAVMSKCPVCGWEQETEIPFGRLFSPRRNI